MQQTTLPFPSYSDPQSSLHLIISSSNKRDLILETFKVRYWCKVSRFVKKMYSNCLLIFTSCTNGWPTNWELSAQLHDGLNTCWHQYHILHKGLALISSLPLTFSLMHCTVQFEVTSTVLQTAHNCNYHFKADSQIWADSLLAGLTQTRM